MKSKVPANQVHFRKTVTVLVAATALAAAIVSAGGAVAQTLTAPFPDGNSTDRKSTGGKTTSPPNAEKAPQAQRAKSCRNYGAGFVAVPGTDACVKIGGFAGADVMMNGH